MPEHSVTFKKLIHAPYDTVINFLHTPTELIDLNPLVIHREPRKDDPSTYDIRDRMKILGIIPYEFNYTVKFTLNEDGIDGEVNAPGGTQLKDHWSAKAVDEENTEVTEDVTVKRTQGLAGSNGP
ncbi:hypothetical protein C8Q75DRAFT_731166 [Abortiporus biennis]|nr:hypothetical protein C8Q75DRAFT_731166 [Abortiporus biennis]